MEQLKNVNWNRKKIETNKYILLSPEYMLTFSKLKINLIPFYFCSNTLFLVESPVLPLTHPLSI